MELAAALVGAGVVAVGCAGKPASGDAAGSAAPVATTAAPTVTASAVATATAAEPAPAATEVPSAEPAVPTRHYDCGARHQKPCPMQGWMKKVMAPASGSGDGAKLAEALEYASRRPPPGYADWTKIAEEGAKKAKAGDVDAAKQSCKTCHDAYKDDYRAKMRDRAW
jgi:hypothetical protein